MEIVENIPKIKVIKAPIARGKKSKQKALKVIQVDNNSHFSDFQFWFEQIFQKISPKPGLKLQFYYKFACTLASPPPETKILFKKSKNSC